MFLIQLFLRKGDYRCFTVNVFGNKRKLRLSDKAEYYERLIINDAKNEGKIITFYVKSNVTEECPLIYIYLHPAREYPKGYVIAPFTVNSSQYLDVVLSYDKVENLLLPFPYPTQCIDYIHLQYESQDDCVEQCLRTNITKGKVPLSVIKSIYDDTLITLNEGTDVSIRLACLEKCPVDCYDIMYFPRLISREMRGNHTISIAVKQAEFKVVYAPVETMTALIVYLAGVIGLWYGASIYVTTKDAVRVINRFVCGILRDKTSAN